MEKRMGKVALLVSVAVLSSNFSHAQPSPGSKNANSETFSVAGQTYTFPIPNGYCRPSDAFVLAAQMAVAMDKDNVTPVVLFDCAQMADFVPGGNMLLVKSTGVASKLTLKDLAQRVHTLARQFGKGTSVEMEPSVSLELGPEATDKNSVYQVATMAVTDKDGLHRTEIPGAIAMAFTTIRGRGFIIELTENAKDESGKALLLEKIEAMNVAFRTAN